MPKMSVFHKLCFGMDDTLANCHCTGFILNAAGISMLSVFKELHVKKLRVLNATFIRCWIWASVTNSSPRATAIYILRRQSYGVCKSL